MKEKEEKQIIDFSIRLNLILFNFNHKIVDCALNIAQE